MSKVINVAQDFSRYPAGRYITDGPFSGEKFRNEYLIPALKDYDEVKVELDGVRGYGSSFLEEAFGGLVRNGFQAKILLDILILITNDKSIIEEIKDYINNGAGS